MEQDLVVLHSSSKHHTLYHHSESCALSTFVSPIVYYVFSGHRTECIPHCLDVNRFRYHFTTPFLYKTLPLFHFFTNLLAGVTIGVPTIIMGLTFLAAGSTMPEAVSSVISLRNGKINYIFLSFKRLNLIFYKF